MAIATLPGPEASADAKRDVVRTILDGLRSERGAPVVYLVIPSPPTPVDRPRVRAAVSGDAVIVDEAQGRFAIATADAAAATLAGVMFVDALVDQITLAAVEHRGDMSAQDVAGWIGALLARPWPAKRMPKTSAHVYDWGELLERLTDVGWTIVDPKLVGG